jgi:hypothetical protein
MRGRDDTAPASHALLPGRPPKHRILHASVRHAASVPGAAVPATKFENSEEPEGTAAPARRVSSPNALFRDRAIERAIGARRADQERSSVNPDQDGLQVRILTHGLFGRRSLRFRGMLSLGVERVGS